MTGRLWAIVAAAGSGLRVGSHMPKQYLKISGKEVLWHSLLRLRGLPLTKIVVVHAPEDPYIHTLVEKVDFSTEIILVEGGATRMDSVYAGLVRGCDAAQREDWVLVHDAARPCLHKEDLANLVDGVYRHNQGAILATPIRDTLKKQIAGQNKIATTVDRQDLWAAQTPQIFKVAKLKQAIEQVRTAGLNLTDEASVMEAVGEQPMLVAAKYNNIKITYPEDLIVAEAILQQMPQEVI